MMKGLKLGFIALLLMTVHGLSLQEHSESSKYIPRWERNQLEQALGSQAGQELIKNPSLAVKIPPQLVKGDISDLIGQLPQEWTYQAETKVQLTFINFAKKRALSYDYEINRAFWIKEWESIPAGGIGHTVIGTEDHLQRIKTKVKIIYPIGEVAVYIGFLKGQCVGRLDLKSRQSDEIQFQSLYGKQDQRSLQGYNLSVVEAQSPFASVACVYLITET